MVNAAEATRVLENMKLTPEEVGRFEKAFKDPKFMDMMREYAEELRDPKHMAETEAYLKQLEEQGRTQEVYGKDVELVLPKAGFTVKAVTKGKNPGRKVFINVCHSDKIDPATSTKVEKGATWDIPYSLSNPKEDKDKSGQPCEVHDFVVHTDAYTRTLASRAFRDFVAKTAIDSVARQRGVEISDDQYTLPKIVYKGNNGTPTVLAFRNRKAGNAPSDNGSSSNGAAAGSLAGPGGPIVPVGVPNDPLLSSSGADAAVDGVNGASKAGSTRSTFSFDKGGKKPAPGLGKEGSQPAGAVAKPSSQPGSQEEALPDGLVRPRYQLVYTETKSYSDAWTDPTIQNVSALRRPASVTITIFLHGVASAAQIDLNVSPQRLQLRVEGRFWLDLELVYLVDDARGRAQFHKSKQTMEVKLPIVPPPAPPPKPFVEPPAATSDPPEEGKAAPNDDVEAKDGAGPKDGQDLKDQAPAMGILHARTGDHMGEPGGVPRVDADASIASSTQETLCRPDQLGDVAVTGNTAAGMEVSSARGGKDQEELLTASGHESSRSEDGVDREAEPQPVSEPPVASLVNESKAEAGSSAIAMAAAVPAAQRAAAPPRLAPRLRNNVAFELD